MVHTIIDVLSYFFKAKKVWMLPIVVAMLLLGFILILAQGSIVAPFIYTVF